MSLLNTQNNGKKDKTKRDEVLTLLLPHVRFPFLSGKFLVEQVEQNVAVNHLPIIRELLHETYKEKVYPNSVKTERTNPRAGFRFEEKGLNAALKLTQEGLTVSCTGGGWYNLRVQQNLTPLHNYIEWKIGAGTTSSMMLGIVQGTCANSGYAGQYANGWTYYSAGQIYHSGMTPSTGQTYAVGDRIGCLYDFELGKLSFYKNGKPSVSLTGNMLPVGKNVNDIYPIACFSGVASVTIVQYAQNPEGKKKKKKSILDPNKKPLTGLGSSTSSVTTGTVNDKGLFRKFLRF